MLVLAWSAWSEFKQVRSASAVVVARAAAAAQAQAQAIAARLDTQYAELQFAATALARTTHDPAHPDPAMQDALRDYVARRPGLWAINIQSADGGAILWSTRPQSAATIFAPGDFMPLPGHVDALFGRAVFAPRVGDVVLSMRVRVRGPDGATRFFVGSPVRISSLLIRPAQDAPWLFHIRVAGQGIDAWRSGRLVRDAPRAHAAAPDIAVPGYPMSVVADWPETLVAAEYWHGARSRLLLEGGLLLALALAATAVGQALRQRDAGLLRAQSLARFNAMLAQASQAIAAADSEDELLRALCGIAVSGTGLELAVISRPGADGRFRALAAAGATGYLDGLVVSADSSIPEGRGSTGRAWREDRAIFNSSFASDPALAPWRERAARFGLRANAALPIHRGEALWAVLSVYHGGTDVFDHDLRQLLVELALDVSRGLDRVDTRARLAEVQREESWRARHDPLTGLPNRFAFEEALPRALARAQREGTVVAVGLIDLDDFKPVNDTWGHEAGDRLLREFGVRLGARLRDADMLARIGGDEFAVLLDGLSEAEAVPQLSQALARMHQAVEAPIEVAPGQGAEVGMSMGLALFPMDAATADGLLRQADAAMYQAKTHKRSRTSWWRLGVDAGEPPQTERALNAYGDAAADLLERWHGMFDEISARFVSELHVRLAQDPATAAVLDALRPDELEALRQAQVDHLRFLLAPRTTPEQILERAEHLGQLHALVGVDAASMVRALGLHRELLVAHLSAVPLSATTRYRLLLKADRRLQDDMQAQLQSLDRTARRYQELLARPLPQAGSLWTDAASAELAELSRLPGLRAALLMRLNPAGELVVIDVAGAFGAPVAAALQVEGASPVLDPASPRGRSLAAEAWRTLRVCSSPRLDGEAGAGPWRDAVDPRMLRSVVAVPVQNQAGHAVAVLCLLGAHPNQFESAWMHQFSRGLKQRWEDAWQRCSRIGAGPVLGQELAQTYRDRLFGGGLTMYVQPLVDLHSGAVPKVEALARLSLGDGGLVSPGAFLPLLGDLELDGLFRIGLDQALDFLNTADARGFALDVALNLPPSTLHDPDCAIWIEGALRRHGVAPGRLTLELLENQAVDQAEQAEAIDRLVRLGVQLAMDDLGSGYSSLKRLSTLPFHTIKIDQDLLAQIRSTPLEVLSLVSTLVQMGRDLERTVVVEGLEDDGMIEAASILGADRGQGYGLARPMPMDELLDWLERRPVTARDGSIRTWLGALAFHWQFVHADRAAPVPLESCPLKAFLDQRGHASDEVARWHARAHEVGDGGRDLLSWLVERVRAEPRA